MPLSDENKKRNDTWWDKYPPEKKLEIEKAYKKHHNYAPVCVSPENNRKLSRAWEISYKRYQHDHPIPSQNEEIVGIPVYDLLNLVGIKVKSREREKRDRYAVRAGARAEYKEALQLYNENRLGKDEFLRISSHTYASKYRANNRPSKYGSSALKVGLFIVTILCSIVAALGFTVVLASPVGLAAFAGTCAAFGAALPLAGYVADKIHDRKIDIITKKAVETETARKTAKLNIVSSRQASPNTVNSPEPQSGKFVEKLKAEYLPEIPMARAV